MRPDIPEPYAVILQPGSRLRLVADLGPKDYNATITRWSVRSGEWRDGCPSTLTWPPRNAAVRRAKAAAGPGLF